jgi:hypothetical protein
VDGAVFQIWLHFYFYPDELHLAMAVPVCVVGQALKSCKAFPVLLDQIKTNPVCCFAALEAEKKVAVEGSLKPWP